MIDSYAVDWWLLLTIIGCPLLIIITTYLIVLVWYAMFGRCECDICDNTCPECGGHLSSVLSGAAWHCDDCLRLNPKHGDSLLVSTKDKGTP